MTTITMSTMTCREDQSPRSLEALVSQHKHPLSYNRAGLLSQDLDQVNKVFNSVIYEHCKFLYQNGNAVV